MFKLKLNVPYESIMHAEMRPPFFVCVQFLDHYISQTRKEISRFKITIPQN